MVDEISDLRLFTRIIAAGSLSQMARENGMSLPVVSRRLAALEARLGTRLIHRGSRHFRLTQEGALLQDRALRVLAEIEDIEAEVSAGKFAPKGHLRVGVPLEIGRSQIAPIVGEFTGLHPGITIELVLTDASVELPSDELDLALHIDLPSDASLVVRTLVSSRRVVCASSDYIDTFGLPQSLDELRQHNCIRLLRGRRSYDPWIFHVDGKETRLDVTGTLSTSSSEVMHEWALAGRGVAMKAGWDVEQDIASGRLVKLLPDIISREIALYAIYPSRQHLPARTRSFIDFVAARLQGRPRLASGEQANREGRPGLGIAACGGR